MKSSLISNIYFYLNLFLNDRYIFRYIKVSKSKYANKISNLSHEYYYNFGRNEIFFISIYWHKIACSNYFYLHRLTIDCYDNNTSKENIIMLFRKCLDYITTPHVCTIFSPPLVSESVVTNLRIHVFGTQKHIVWSTYMNQKVFIRI